MAAIAPEPIQSQEKETELAELETSFEDPVWVSPLILEWERLKAFLVFRHAQLPLVCPFVPQNIKQWLAHHAIFTQMQANELKRKVRRLEERNRVANAQKLTPIVQTKRLESGGGVALGMPAIWTQAHEVDENQSAWPSVQDMKEHGWRREGQNRQRVLPFPRRGSSPDSSWRQQNVQEQHKFDSAASSDRNKFHLHIHEGKLKRWLGKSLSSEIGLKLKSKNERMIYFHFESHLSRSAASHLE